MDGCAYDRLTRALSAQPTRRRLLGLVTALPLAGIVTAHDDERTAAVGRHRSKSNRKRKHRCSSGGRPLTNRKSCGGGNICCNGACCSGCCDGNGTCSACRVFVTSTLHDGNLKGSSGSGSEGADTICQQLASSATPPLPGTYIAWLSDSTSSPSTRFRCTKASCSSQGYRLVDGTTVVADDWTDLITCDPGNGPCLAHAIDRTELNDVVIFSALAWTHTNTNGTPGGISPGGDGHCQNWSTNDRSPFADGGVASLSDAGWTRDVAVSCSNPLGHLYCFQQS